MSNAILIQDIIAFEDGDESATKMFSKGTRITVEDSESDWFGFYPEDDSSMYYECEEAPIVVLSRDGSDQAVEPVTTANAYEPVPNMTPLTRKYLLL